MSSVVNLNTPFGAEPQVYNVFALVPLGATVSNRLILQAKSSSSRGLFDCGRLARRIAEKVPRCCPIQPKVSQFHE